MDKSCLVVLSGNSKRLECFLLYMCGARGCVCARDALIYASYNTYSACEFATEVVD